jgi:hypothetical protein
MNLWTVVNLVAPIGAPILGALIVTPFVYKSGSKNKRGHPLGAFKDGQLCWVVMGMCFNAFYELRTPSEGMTVPTEFTNTMGVALIVLMLLSTGLAVLGSAMPVPWPKPSATPLGPLKASVKFLVDFAVLLFSIAATVAVVYVAWNVHLTTQK